jgi:hypothetical protein
MWATREQRKGATNLAAVFSERIFNAEMGTIFSE